MIDLVSDGAPARSRTYRYRLACDPAAAWEGSLSGTLDEDPVQVEWGPDRDLDYLSPAFSAATANRLGAPRTSRLCTSSR